MMKLLHMSRYRSTILLTVRISRGIWPLRFSRVVCYGFSSTGACFDLSPFRIAKEWEINELRALVTAHTKHEVIAERLARSVAKDAGQLYEAREDFAKAVLLGEFEPKKP